MSCMANKYIVEMYYGKLMTMILKDPKEVKRDLVKG